MYFILLQIRGYKFPKFACLYMYFVLVKKHSLFFHLCYFAWLFPVLFCVLFPVLFCVLFNVLFCVLYNGVFVCYYLCYLMCYWMCYFVCYYLCYFACCVVGAEEDSVGSDGSLVQSRMCPCCGVLHRQNLWDAGYGHLTHPTFCHRSKSIARERC
jgi:hypothetical protein